MSVATAIPAPVARPQTAPGEPQAAPTLAVAFRRQVELGGDRPALYARADSGWSAITWREYGETVRRMSSMLIDAGLGLGDHVAIWAANRPEWVIASAAVLCAGGCTVPVYVTLSDEQIAYELGHSGTVLAFVEDVAMLDRLTAMRDRLPELRAVIVIEGLEGGTPPGGLGVAWASALAAGEDRMAANAATIDDRIEAVRPEDVATLIYTSGTTGPPKAVMATHRNLTAAIRMLGPVIGCSPDDRVISYLPLAHVLERANTEIRLYAFGNACWFVPRMTDLPRALREVRPTFFMGVPRVWEKMADTIRDHIAGAHAVQRSAIHAAMRVTARVRRRAAAAGDGTAPTGFAAHLADRLVLSKIRDQLGLDQAVMLISGAAPISVDLLEFYATLGLHICEGYGMTENMATTSVNPSGAIRIGTVGTAVPGMEIAIAEDGEILVRGEPVFAGYYRDEQASAATVVDGWLHTGDIGELDPDGYLRITDRKKDLIITAGGKNIAPTVIETLLAEHPLVADAVVIGDRRPYITALLTLDRTRAAAAAAGVAVEIERHVAWVNDRLSNVEKVRRYTLLESDFHIGEELTPTYKVRRPFVATRYAEVIDSMYVKEQP